MLDFRTENEKKMDAACVIHCDACGNKSLVSVYHKKYCPVCGPDVVSPVTVTKVIGNASGELRHVETTFEVTLRKCEEAYVDMETYEKLYNGDSTPIAPEMDSMLRSAASHTFSDLCRGNWDSDFETDYTLYDIDADKQVVDWR